MFRYLNKFPQARFSQKKQCGVVIVVALFIVALIAVMSYAMMARFERDIERTRLTLHTLQGEFYARASIDWALAQLSNNMMQKKPNQLIDEIPIRSPVNEVNNYRIHSTVYDLQARINVNNLLNVESQTSFRRMLSFLKPSLNQEQTDILMKAIIDWIDPGSHQIEFEKQYTTAEFPYRAAHRSMVSISELKLVQGMKEELFAQLQPNMVALPAPSLINIQTATELALLTLSPKMTLDAAKAIIEFRKKKPILEPDEFVKTELGKNFAIDEKLFVTVSEYFLIETEVSIEEQKILLYTVVKRNSDPQNNKVSTQILTQSKGVWS